MTIDKSRMDYKALMAKAMRGLVREVLADVSERGLRGGHHFFISFATEAEGVEIPPSVKKPQSDEMVIILQHRFEDLEVSKTSFSVTLWFKDVEARLTIPFDAVTSFADPSAGFGLQMDIEEDAEPPKQPEKPQEHPDKKEEKERPSGEVVTLDSFRKK